SLVDRHVDGCADRARRDDGRPIAGAGDPAVDVIVAVAGVAELHELAPTCGCDRDHEQERCGVEDLHGVVPSLRMMKSTTNSTRRFVTRPAAVPLVAA